MQLFPHICIYPFRRAALPRPRICPPACPSSRGDGQGHQNQGHGLLVLTTANTTRWVVHLPPGQEIPGANLHRPIHHVFQITHGLILILILTWAMSRGPRIGHQLKICPNRPSWQHHTTPRHSPHARAIHAIYLHRCPGPIVQFPFGSNSNNCYDHCLPPGFSSGSKTQTSNNDNTSADHGICRMNPAQTPLPAN